jgi:hypothetical protein
MHKRLWILTLKIFGWAVSLNFVWEMAQAFFYTEMGPSLLDGLIVCGLASLVDGLIILGIYGSGVVIFRRTGWIRRPRFAGYFLMLTAGFSVSAIIELNAVYHRGAWGYLPMMPILPFFGVGLLPVLQMVLLPPIIFVIVARREKGPSLTV